MAVEFKFNSEHERVLFQAMAAGEDGHTAVASHVYDVAPEQVTKAQRESAKRLNYYMLYSPQSMLRLSNFLSAMGK